MISIVHKYSMLTADLIQQAVRVQYCTFRVGEEASERNLYNRIKRLVERKEIYQLGRDYTGKIVYATKVPRGKRPHISHNLSVGRFGVSLEIATHDRPELGYSEWCSDQSTLIKEFKDGERCFVPDSRFVLNGFQNFLEFHTGSQDSEKTILPRLALPAPGSRPPLGDDLDHAWPAHRWHGRGALASG
jgi:hypothetical protein